MRRKNEGFADEADWVVKDIKRQTRGSFWRSDSDTCLTHGKDGAIKVLSSGRRFAGNVWWWSQSSANQSLV